MPLKKLVHISGGGGDERSLDSTPYIEVGMALLLVQKIDVNLHSSSLFGNFLLGGPSDMAAPKKR